MATALELLRIRSMIGELTEAEPWTDIVLAELIDENESDLTAVAIIVWEAKAAAAAGYVDTTESGSSRRLSQVHENALKMLAYYRGLGSVNEPTDLSGYAYTVAIERP